MGMDDVFILEVFELTQEEGQKVVNGDCVLYKRHRSGGSGIREKFVERK